MRTRGYVSTSDFCLAVLATFIGSFIILGFCIQ